MSNVCVLVASNLNAKRQALESQVRKKVDQIGCGVFFDDYQFFSAHSRKESFICSFSDNYKVNNCEMLLLPDNCWLNGNKTNLVPFFYRMELLGCVIESILEFCNNVELFVGNSGEYRIEDFQICDIDIADFAPFMDQYFNNTQSFAAHLFLHRRATRKY